MFAHPFPIESLLVFPLRDTPILPRIEDHPAPRYSLDASPIVGRVAAVGVGSLQDRYRPFNLLHVHDCPVCDVLFAREADKPVLIHDGDEHHKKDSDLVGFHPDGRVYNFAEKLIIHYANGAPIT